MMLSNSLKEIATEYQIFVMSATQLSGDYEKAKFRNANFIRGSKAVADKIDVGAITMRLSEEEKENANIIASTLNCKLTPNIVTDIFKNRRGDLTDTRIFSYFDYGTCRIVDLFATDVGLNVITDYQIYEQKVKRKSLDELLMDRKECTNEI